MKVPRSGVVKASVAALAIATPFAYSSKSQTTEKIGSIRALELQQTQLARSVGILKDHPLIVAEMNKGAYSVESLSLSIIESLELAFADAELNLEQLSVMPNDKPVDSEIPYTLRVDFSAKLAYTMQLLPIFKKLRTALNWRPVDIRRCHIVRAKVDESALLANCSIDVYYFAGVDD